MENFILNEKMNANIEFLLQNNDAFFDTIETILFKSRDEKNICRLCTKLIEFYKEKDERFQYLIINCFPNLIRSYFSYAQIENKTNSTIEACLLTIYNLSLTGDNAKAYRIRVPNLSSASVYHNPHNSSTQSELIDSALFKLDSDHAIFTDQFKPYNDLINTEKRMNIINYLLIIYYSMISNATKQSKLAYCEMCIKLTKKSRLLENKMKIYLNNSIYIEMLKALFYILHNNGEYEAYKAIECIANRADEDLIVEIILICNSMKNLLDQTKLDFSKNLANLNETKITLSNPSPINIIPDIEESSKDGNSTD